MKKIQLSPMFIAEPKVMLSISSFILMPFNFGINSTFDKVFGIVKIICLSDLYNDFKSINFTLQYFLQAMYKDFHPSVKSK